MILDADQLLAELGEDAEFLAAGARRFLTPDIEEDQENGPTERPEGEEPRA